MGVDNLLHYGRVYWNTSSRDPRRDSAISNLSSSININNANDGDTENLTVFSKCAIIIYIFLFFIPH